MGPSGIIGPSFMAYITGEYNHEDYDITVQVLQPTKDEESYREGRKVDVDWDSMLSLTTAEITNVLNWLKSVNVHIKKNFDRKGRKKDTYLEFNYNDE